MLIETKDASVTKSKRLICEESKNELPFSFETSEIEASILVLEIKTLANRTNFENLGASLVFEA